MKRLVFIVVAIMSTLTGCGGGGSSEPATPLGTAVSLTTVKTYLNGSAAGADMVFPLTGSDQSGNAYTGSFTVAPDGATNFEGVDVTAARIISSLTRTSTGATGSGTVTWYCRVADGSLYKQVSSPPGAITSVPSQQTPLPNVGHVGDFGNFWALSNSDGTTEVVTWQLNPDYNGNSKLIFSSVTRDNSSTVTVLEEDTFYLTAAGSPYRYQLRLTASGTTLTLSGNRQ